MEIQQLTSKDAAGYKKLRLFALQESPAAFGSSYEEEVKQPLQIVIDRLADSLNHIFGAVNDGEQLVGIITLRRQPKQKSHFKANIFAMYVLPAYRQQGIGRALLKRAIDRGREIGLRQINLSVVAANKPAVSLYKGHGFLQFGLERDSFMVDGEYYHEAYMVLPLA